MHVCDNQQPDHTIIALLAENHKDAWPHIYDKYASMIYGIIFNMTGDEAIAGELLTEIFLELKQKKLLARVQTALCHTLVRLTHKLTIKLLNARGLTPISIQLVNGNYPIISSLYFELTTINEKGADSAVTKQEILKNLRAEFNHFRNQNK